MRFDMAVARQNMGNSGMKKITLVQGEKLVRLVSSKVKVKVELY